MDRNTWSIWRGAFRAWPAVLYFECERLLMAHSGHSHDRRRRLPRLGWRDNILSDGDGRELLTKLGPTAPIGSFLKGFVRLRPMLVLWHEARPGRFARLAYPDLSIRVQTGAAGRRNGGEPRAMQQAGVGLTAVRMDAAVSTHHLFPRRLAVLENGRICRCDAVELVLIQIRDALVTVLHEGDRSALASFRAQEDDDKAEG